VAAVLALSVPREIKIAAMNEVIDLKRNTENTFAERLKNHLEIVCVPIDNGSPVGGINRASGGDEGSSV